VLGSICKRIKFTYIHHIQEQSASVWGAIEICVIGR
jgi:hypothetical protein